jgi:ABC-type nitrate/sulfonate/bicarbonate transport system substrate-binding protein
MKNKRLITVVLLASIAIAVAGFIWSRGGTDGGSGAAAPTLGTPLKRISFQIDWKAEPLYAGLWIARSKGYFAKAGFDVDILQGNGASLATQVIGVGSGPVIGTANGAETVIARSKGIPVKSAAVLYPRTATVMVSLPRAPIATPQDLVGRKIGLIPGTVTTNEYRALVEANNIDRGKVTEITVDWNVTPLLSGAVDGLIFYEDNVPVQLRLEGKNPTQMRFREFGVDLYSLNIIVNEAAYAREKADLDKIIDAVVMAYEDIRRDPEAAAAIFIKEFPERDPAYVQASMKVVAQLLGDGPVGQQTDRGWDATSRTLENLGMLDRRVSPSDVWIAR